MWDFSGLLVLHVCLFVVNFLVLFLDAADEADYKWACVFRSAVCVPICVYGQ